MAKANTANIQPKKDKNRLIMRIKRHIPFYLMIMPVVIFFLLFSYGPMLNVDIAFRKFHPMFGKQEWVGLENFARLLTTPKFLTTLGNTLSISLVNLFLNMLLSVVFALMLNEVTNVFFKRAVQTAVYLPHFLSWVVVASIFIMVLSPNTGFTGPIYEMLGITPENPLTNSRLWRVIYHAINAWKSFGYGAIVYLAAITGIDPVLYEAASIDGAGKWKQTMHITLPALTGTMLVVLILNLSKVLNVFDSVFVLQNPLVYGVSDVLGTYTYRLGLVERDYSFATAVGLFRSFVAAVLIFISNYASKRIRGRGII